jgi:AraC family L-rhamnose operon transcriptional activator RhaR
MPLTNPPPPADPEHLAAAQLFPPGRVQVHANRPRHDGDVPLHDHDFLEVVVVESGRALHRTLRGLEPIAAGDALVIPPGRWHAYEQAAGLVIRNLCVGTATLGHALAWTTGDPRLAVVTAPRDVLRLRLDEAHRQRALAASDAILAARSGGAAAELIAHALLLVSVMAESLPAPAQAAEADPAIDALVAAMAARLDRPWGLAELARTAACDRSVLVRRFRRRLGVPPMRWLARQRIEQAAVWLLTTALPVAEVGRRVGLADPNHFARCFRATFGQPPGSYRRQLPVPPLPARVRPESWIQW